MKTGHCPKCHASAVHKKYNGFETNGGLYLGLSVFSAAAVDVYVCTTCGYIECYVADEDKLPKIAEKWAKVPSH